MLKHFNKIKAAAFLATLTLSFSNHAETSAELRKNFLEGLLTPQVYKGFKGKIQTLEPKWGCSDRRYFWSLDWQSEVKDVEVKFDPRNPDLTNIRLVLGESSVRAQHYTRGGVTCTWDGGEGELVIGRIDVEFSLKAVPTKDFPDISLDGLRVEDFQLRNVKLMYASVFEAGFKRSSQGFGDWVESNLNGLIAGFLKTSLKKRLDDAINKEVERRLKEREDSLVSPHQVAGLN